MPETFPGISEKLGQMVIFGLSCIKSSTGYKLRKACSPFEWKDKIWSKVWLVLNCQSKKICTVTPTLVSSKIAVIEPVSIREFES